MINSETNIRIFKNIIQKQYIIFNIELFSHLKALDTSLRMYLGHENISIKYDFTYDCWTASTNASAARSPSLLEASGLSPVNNLRS